MNARTLWILAVVTATLLALQSRAATVTMSVSAVVPSANNCRFSTNTLTLDFGAIDPASASNATKTVNGSFRCTGKGSVATYALSVSDGQNPAGPGLRRMRHASGELLPYSVSVSPQSGSVPKGDIVTFSVTGTVLAMDFQNARAGDYQDVATITIVP